MKPTIIAFNINTGGAKILLNTLIKRLIDRCIYSVVIIKNMDVIHEDYRTNDYITYKLTYSNVTSALTLLKKINNALYFGNLPPLRRSIHSILYIHNPYLTLTTKEIFGEKLSLVAKAKLLALKTHLQFCHSNVNNIGVQTNEFAKKITNLLNRPVLLLPFFEKPEISHHSITKKFDFCYVGLPSKHKNHELLLEGIWLSLKSGEKFSIALTIPGVEINKPLLEEIEQINSLHPGTIVNYGLSDVQTVKNIYSESRALIFPSNKETLGLPLIEALQYKLKILASDLPFSYDAIDRPIVFNQNNAREISEVMTKFLHHEFDGIKQAIRLESHIDTIINLISNEK